MDATQFIYFLRKNEATILCPGLVFKQPSANLDGYREDLIHCRWEAAGYTSVPTRYGIWNRHRRCHGAFNLEGISDTLHRPSYTPARELSFLWIDRLPAFGCPLEDCACYTVSLPDDDVDMIPSPTAEAIRPVTSIERSRTPSPSATNVLGEEASIAIALDFAACPTLRLVSELQRP